MASPYGIPGLPRKGRNHPDEVRKRGGVDEKVDDRHTPDKIYLPLHTAHGFTLDVAASASNTKCARFFNRETNGLAQSWAGEVAWCNPPYSSIRAWIEKALHEVAHGCKKVVLLLPANRSEQGWWQDLIEPVRDRGAGVSTTFLRGRPSFGNVRTRDGREGCYAQFGCVVVVIEPCPLPSSGPGEKA